MDVSRCDSASLNLLRDSAYLIRSGAFSLRPKQRFKIGQEVSQQILSLRLCPVQALASFKRMRTKGELTTDNDL